MEIEQSERIRIRIRQLRRERGLTLRDFEEKSGGKIRAIVMGAYERGDRSMSLGKLIEISKVFGIELSHLIGSAELTQSSGTSSSGTSSSGTLSSATPSSATPSSRYIFDLRVLNSLDDSPQKVILLRYLSRIAEQRGDWGGEVISLRQSDIESLSKVIDSQTNTFEQWIQGQAITLTKR
jgi:transcriptional regulator with XRE-family HTH domain